jgi:hypothetical protein
MPNLTITLITFSACATVGAMGVFFFCKAVGLL